MRRQDVTKLLRQIGLRPQKAAGQHFLCDESIVQRMVTAAEIQPGDRVLEIGPGLGILTRQLIGAGAEVIAVELDARLAGYLRSTFTGTQNLQIIEQDIFAVHLDQHFREGQYQVVANLPYGVTSLLMRNLMTIVPRPKKLTVMIQKEVARRMVALPGEMSLLGLMTQYYSDTTIVFDVPRTAFVPPPEVTSSVIQSTILPLPDATEAKRVFQLARGAFAGRRKQLQNSLATALQLPTDVLKRQLSNLGISPSARPQELTLENWRRLAKNLF